MERGPGSGRGIVRRTGGSRRTARPALTLAAAGLLLIAGCASQPGHVAGGQAPAGPSPKALATQYLTIAAPANRQLDREVDAYNDQARRNLTVAESALRAEAATERRFDQLLLTIRFPARIAATAHALARINQGRIDLTELQAESTSLAGLQSFTAGHQAADAAVEVQVRAIRRQLGLPPPDNS
jgi:hypothetical protein